jgi:hypothetical protein
MEYRWNGSRETRENALTNKNICQEVFRKALGKCLVAFQFFQLFFFGKLSGEKSLLL